MTEKSEQNKDLKIALILFLFAFVYVFFCSMCSPLYLFNDWTDPNIYFSMGKGALNGEILYKDIFDHKGPLIFFIYAAAYLIAQTNFVGIYIFESLALFVSMIFSYKLARFYLNRPLSFGVAVFFASLLFLKNYNGGSADEFVSTFVTISFYYFVLYVKESTTLAPRQICKQLFIHGTMFACTFYIKFTFCVIWVPLLVAFAFDLIYKKNLHLLLKSIISFILGFLLISLPLLSYFVVNDAMPDFIHGYFSFNKIYGKVDDPYSVVITRIWLRFIDLLRSNYIAFGLVLFSLILILFTHRFVSKFFVKLAFILSFFSMFIILTMGERYMSYPYISLFIFGQFGLIFIMQILQIIIHNKYSIAIYATSFIFAIAIGLNIKRFFGQDILCLTRQKSCSYPQAEFAKIINQYSNPTLLVLNLDCGFYTKANITPTYKYFFHPYIDDEDFPDIAFYQRNLVKQKVPLFVITAQYHLHTFPEIKNYYDLIKVDQDSAYFLYRRIESEISSN